MQKIIQSIKYLIPIIKQMVIVKKQIQFLNFMERYSMETRDYVIKMNLIILVIIMEIYIKKH
jgi:hypothetical protein